MKHRALILIVVLVLLATAFFIFDFYKKSEIPAEEINHVEIKNILTPQEGLPPLVEAKRQAIYTAALSRDYEKLNKETSTDFHYSFGGDYEDGFIGYLKLAEKDESKSAFDIISILLQLPYTKRDNLYSWPSVFSIEPSKWTPEDITIMQTFLTDKQIESFREYGGYIYYRLGITSLGEWTFYLAGD